MAFVVDRLLFGALILGLACLFDLGRLGGDRLSHALRRSTIGAGGFHVRVRDGIGCLTSAVATKPSKIKGGQYQRGPEIKGCFLKCALRAPSWAPCWGSSLHKPPFIFCLSSRAGVFPLHERRVAMESDDGIKPIERLVRLSFTHCCASTCLLSTWWSTTALGRDLVLR